MPFLPFFHFVPGVICSEMPNSSGFAARRNLTFGVMGGKNGKMRQESGNEVATDGTVGGKNGNDARDASRVHAAAPRAVIGRGRRFRLCMRLLRCQRREVAPRE